MSEGHPKVLMVYWIDACSWGGLWSEEDAAALEPVIMLTVGVLVADKPTCYVLAAERQSNDGQVRHVFTIPKELVTEVYEVEAAE